jgi:hypothetical protein
MQAGSGNKPSMGDILRAVAMAAVALLFVLIFVPKFAERIGVKEQHIGYVMAAAAFLIVAGAVRWLKSQNQKSAGKTGTTRRKP